MSIMDTLRLHLSSYSSSYFSNALLAGLVLIPIIVVLTSPQLRKWQSNLSLLRFGHRQRTVTEVTALRVYPIKSCRGFQVSRTTLRLQGLDLDRRWMFVDARTREFLTIRQIPQMTLISTALSDDGESLLISVSGKTVSIPAHPSDEWLAANTTLAGVKIWDLETDGYLYGRDVNEPFSAFLQKDVCLVYKGPTPRVLRGNGDPRVLGRTQTTFFPDVHPVLIASETSMAELNARLAKKGVDPITIERFRPNIVVKGTVPWAEDTWKLVRISQTSTSTSPEKEQKQEKKPLDIDIIARCTRCQVPNVDPSTANKHQSEPWDTLMSYRRVDEGMKYKPCFGMLSAPRNEGEIEVGMKLEVLAETKQHRYVKGF